MYERILVPTDGSTGSAHVTLQALDLAEQYGATIHAISVVERDLLSRVSESDPTSEQLQDHAAAAITQIERMAQAHDVAVETAVREGDPATEVLDFASDVDADLIVAGTHGRSGLRRQLLGSVAERLVRHATCPVMTVRLPETDVTIDDAPAARTHMLDALDAAGYESSDFDIERQLTVWVGRAATEDGAVVVYLDPVTQRTSVLPGAARASDG